MDSASIDLGGSFSANSTMRSDSPRAGKIKARLQDLEETLILQRSEYDELLDKMEQLEKKQDQFMRDTDHKFTTMNDRMTVEIEKYLGANDHKFSLQLAENKRLTTQKKEIEMLIEKYGELNNRVRRLGEELG